MRIHKCTTYKTNKILEYSRTIQVEKQRRPGPTEVRIHSFMPLLCNTAELPKLMSEINVQVSDTFSSLAQQSEVYEVPHTFHHS